MSHIHSIYDSDKHFSINPVARVIKNDSGKITLIQHDHNSERFTFEIPRYVEEHDMSLCNKVEVHYINIDASKKESHSDVYEVDDLQISPDSDDVVICSWLISRAATQFTGSLNFVIRFSCVAEDGKVEYAWHTAVHSGILVSTGIYNSDVVYEEHQDVLERWQAEFESNIAKYDVLEPMLNEAVERYENCIEATENANKAAIDAAAVRSKIESGGFIESLKELNKGEKFSFWVGSTEEYKNRTETIPNCLYFITDELSLVERVTEILNPHLASIDNKFELADNRIDAARDHAEGLNENARGYTDNKLTEAKDYTNEKINEGKAVKFIPKFDDIDNLKFKNLFVECIRNWKAAAAEQKIIYQNAKNVDKPYVINPFIYSTYENNSFTDTYRDIYADALKSPITVGETTYKPSLNCISFCAAVLMGITYDFSRLKGHENLIGAAGYGFDIGKLVGDEANKNPLANNALIGGNSSSIISENGLIKFNPSDTLNINTFKHNLAGDWFYQVYDRLGLAKRLSTNAQGGGDILSYTDLRIGDVYCYGYDKDGDGIVEQHEHSMFCLGVTSTNSENIIKYADIVDDGTISEKFMKIDGDGRIYISTDGANFKAKDTKYKLLWAARPYYEPYSHTFSQNIYKQFRDPVPLASGTDLNECLSVGEYSAQTQAIALSIYNRPTDLSFRLTVENLTTYDTAFSTSKVTNFLQTVIAKDGHEFVRTIYGNLNDSGVIEKRITDWKERAHNTVTTLNPKPTN